MFTFISLSRSSRQAQRTVLFNPNDRWGRRSVWRSVACLPGTLTLLPQIEPQPHPIKQSSKLIASLWSHRPFDIPGLLGRREIEATRNMVIYTINICVHMVSYPLAAEGTIFITLFTEAALSRAMWSEYC